MGFNTDWSKNQFYNDKIKSIITDKGLKQIMPEFTRIVKSLKTIIDYIITNNKSIAPKINN